MVEMRRGGGGYEAAGRGERNDTWGATCEGWLVRIKAAGGVIDDCGKVTYLECCGAQDAFSRQMRGIKVVMMLHLPVIVLGCGKEDPSWLDKSAAVLIFAESHSKVQTLRFTGDPKIPPKEPRKEGYTGRLGVVARGRLRLVQPEWALPLDLSFAVNQKLIVLQKCSNSPLWGT